MLGNCICVCFCPSLRRVILLWLCEFSLPSIQPLCMTSIWDFYEQFYDYNFQWFDAKHSRTKHNNNNCIIWYRKKSNLQKKVTTFSSENSSILNQTKRTRKQPQQKKHFFLFWAAQHDVKEICFGRFKADISRNKFYQCNLACLYFFTKLSV